MTASFGAARDIARSRDHLKRVEGAQVIGMISIASSVWTKSTGKQLPPGRGPVPGPATAL
jgi:hypothetical protein